MVEEEALIVPVCRKPEPPLYVRLCPRGQTYMVVERLSVCAGVNEAVDEDSPCWDYLHHEYQFADEGQQSSFSAPPQPREGLQLVKESCEFVGGKS